MTGSRLLAIFLAACALAASALIALPLDDAEGSGDTAAFSAPDRYQDLATRPSRTNPETGDEAHAALPRIWLGNPVTR